MSSVTLVKAEILWTRVCPLRCHYCGMRTGYQNTPTSHDWRVGLENLKELGCQFIAIYGAEPLSDFSKLPQFVRDVQDLGFSSTLITAGASGWKDKLRCLHDAGLRSLTTSYDILPLDSSSAKKSNRAIEMLDFFRSLGDVTNVGVVVTLTKHNFRGLISTIKQMTEEEIWTFFDVIHWNRGQAGSKVIGRDPTLCFTEDNLPELKQVVRDVQTLRRAGALLHCSNSFLETLITTDVVVNMSWNCANEDVFPSWVTVNCDGMVFPCDDFQPPELAIPMVSLSTQLPLRRDEWATTTLRRCPGCCWNTHVDAHNIKKGELSIDEYIHE